MALVAGGSTRLARDRFSRKRQLRTFKEAERCCATNPPSRLWSGWPMAGRYRCLIPISWLSARAASSSWLRAVCGRSSSHCWSSLDFPGSHSSATFGSVGSVSWLTTPD